MVDCISSIGTTKVTFIDNVVHEVKKRSGLFDDRLCQFYALLVLTKGTNIVAEDVHNAWAMNMNFKKKTDKCYGHDHINIVPYYSLSPAVKQALGKTLIVLRNIAAELSSGMV